MFKSLLAVCLLFSIQSFANPKAKEAADAFAKRDYNPAGAKKVQEAIKLYDEAIKLEKDEFQKMYLTMEKGIAYYFLGTALDKKKERMAAHQTGMDIADMVTSEMDVDPEKAHELTPKQITEILNRLDDKEEMLLADALYHKGINLGQWGRLNGIASSIGRLPIVLGLMDRVKMMGFEEMHYYGPGRTVGRIEFILPKIFGGDLAESEKELKVAFKNTLAPGQKYSMNGYNNLYLAETLYKRGKEKQAENILKLFVAADPKTLAPGNEPENKEALRLAEELLEEWK